MKNDLKFLFVKRAVALYLLAIASLAISHVAAAWADGAAGTAPTDTKTFIVQEGAYPWYDRVNNWALTKVPDSLKGSGPVPQESCSSRSLDIAGSPKSILIGVSNNDIKTFASKEPTAVQTKDTIGVKNAGGTEIDYTIFELDNPPAKIDGTGLYSAGLILLQVK